MFIFPILFLVLRGFLFRLFVWLAYNERHPRGKKSSSPKCSFHVILLKLLVLNESRKNKKKTNGDPKYIGALSCFPCSFEFCSFNTSIVMTAMHSDASHDKMHCNSKTVAYEIRIYNRIKYGPVTFSFYLAGGSENFQIWLHILEYERLQIVFVPSKSLSILSILPVICLLFNNYVIVLSVRHFVVVDFNTHNQNK